MASAKSNFLHPHPQHMYPSAQHILLNGLLASGCLGEDIERCYPQKIDPEQLDASCAPGGFLRLSKLRSQILWLHWPQVGGCVCVHTCVHACVRACMCVFWPLLWADVLCSLLRTQMWLRQSVSLSLMVRGAVETHRKKLGVVRPDQGRK